MQKIKAYMNINEFKENPMIKESIDKNIFNFRYSLPSDSCRISLKNNNQYLNKSNFNKNEEMS